MKPGIFLLHVQWIFIVIVGMLTACSNTDAPSTPAKATAKDTTRAVELAIHTVLTQDFPEAPAMKQVAAFRDSLYLAAGSFPENLLPERVDSFRLNVLPDSVVCLQMRSDTSLHNFPNYLRLAGFENRDSGYFIKLESLNCQRGNEAGSVGLFIIKTKDNFFFSK
jgi:hypothetical protein